MVDSTGATTNLEVAELGKLLPAFFELAHVRLVLLVHDLVCAYVAPLREPLAADVAVVRPLPGMAAFVGLEGPV